MLKNGKRSTLTENRIKTIKDNWQIFRQQADAENEYEIAFLLAPDIVFPSRTGHSIASLVDALAEGLAWKSLVFCYETPKDFSEITWECSYSLAVYRKELANSIWDGPWVFRAMKQRLITPTRLAWRQYARDCALACIEMGVKCLIVEDVADFVWASRVVHKHGVKVLLHQHAFTQRNYNSYLWSRIESNLDHIIFVSRTTLDNTLKKFGRLSKPVEVVYNGVDLGRFKPKKIDHRDDEEDREPSITQVLFVGRLAYSKGVFELIEAVKRLNSKRLALTIVVSTTPEDSEINKEFNLALSDPEFIKNPIQVLYNCSPEIVIEAYRKSNILIVPSHNYYEGLPKVVTEALAMGVPVIASDRGGTWELVEEGKTGWMIKNPVGAGTIMEALEKALETAPSELAKMQEYILTHDRPKMDQKVMVEKFSGIISGLIGPSR
jgi:glycosyltransferase involved in cell wall biosynthesis